MATIDGTSGNDLIDESAATDKVKIKGKDGDDTLKGGSDKDDIDGDGGDDSIVGNGGDDKLDGGDGDDTIDGGDGEDDIKGGKGKDTVLGGRHDDKIDGDDGDDYLDGGDGDDDIKGGKGDDTILGGDGEDKIKGDDGDDLIYAGAGDDDVKGGKGDDTAQGGLGDDKMDGGSGIDTAVYSGGIADYSISGTGSGGISGGGKLFVTDLYAGDGDEGTDELKKFEFIYFEADDYTLDLTGANNVPLARDDSAETDEDSSVNISGAALLANDFDPDPGDVLTISAVDAVSASGGLIADNGNGTFTYDPNGAFEALAAGVTSTDTFTYTVSDGDGATDTATVTVTITGVNDAPVASDDTGSGDEDTDITGNVLDNDNDIDSTGLTAALLSGPAHGSVVLNLDGSYTYTPDADYNGTDSFTYTVSDGDLTDTATVSLTVDPVNDAPVASDDTGSGDEDTDITGNVLDNDNDIDSTGLTAALLSGPAHGSVVLNLDGSYTYTPDADYNGTDSFTYTVSDGDLTDTATVSLTVDPVNDAPVASDDTGSGDEDTDITGNVLDNDNDIDSTGLTAALLSGPAHGSVVLNLDGSYTYTPDADYNGTDSFTYTVSDGDLTDTATVSLTVDPVNDAPVASDDTGSGDEDTDITGNVLDNDNDIDSTGLTAALLSGPAHGSVVLNLDGSYTYTPDADYNGTDSFTYTVSDGDLTDTATVSLTVDPVNDAPVSLDLPLTFNEADGPILIDLSTQVQEPDGDLLRFSDIALTAGSTVIPFSILTGGKISIDPSAIPGLNTGDTLTVTFSYTVTENSGAANDSDTGVVPVTINGLDDPLPPGNTAPTANPLTLTADEEDGTITIPLSGLISDPDEGDVLTIISLRSDFYSGTAIPSGVNVPFAGGVTLGEGGVLTFDPVGFGLEEGATETITLTYIVEDAGGLQATNTITLNLTGDTPGTPDNLPPTAANIPAGPFAELQDVVVDDSENPTLTIDLSGLVNDPDGSNESLVITPGDFVIGSTTEIDPETGEETLVLITAPYTFDSETGIVTITLADIGVADGEEIAGTLNYTVTDAGGASASGQVAYNYVNPEDDAGGSTLIDFEEFAAEDPEFTLEITGVAGFTFDGLATVIETDELENEGSGREPGGIIGGQTTPGGDNVLVGAASTLTVLEPVLDEQDQPVLDSRGQPLFEEVEVLDENFAILAPGQTVEPGAQVLFTTFPNGISFPEPDPLPNGFGTSFDLEGLSLNLTSETTTTVTITTYAFEIVEEPIDGTSSSQYFYSLEEVDAFDFVIDGSTPATEIDFNATDFGLGLTGANSDPTEFDDILAFVITTDDGTPVVLDDILVFI